MFFEELHVLSRRNLPHELCQINEHVCEETDEKDADHTMVVPMLRDFHHKKEKDLKCFRKGATISWVFYFVQYRLLFLQ